MFVKRGVENGSFPRSVRGWIHSDPRNEFALRFRKPMWRRAPDPFRTTAPNQNPYGYGNFVYNLRFPGQYYPPETMWMLRNSVILTFNYVLNRKFGALVDDRWQGSARNQQLINPDRL
jgi:hypothetical protein